MKEKIKQYLISLCDKEGVIHCQLCGDVIAGEIAMCGKIDNPKTMQDYLLICRECKKDVGAGGWRIAELRKNIEEYPHQWSIVTYSRRYKLAVKFGVIPDITLLDNKVKFHFEK